MYKFLYIYIFILKLYFTSYGVDGHFILLLEKYFGLLLQLNNFNWQNEAF